MDQHCGIVPLDRPRGARMGVATASDPAAAIQRRLRTCRRIVETRPRAATRIATPYSQLPTDSRFLIASARRARTRKVAWNASWRSAGSLRTVRQTLSTIGPWRVTKASNARSPPSSRLALNRSINSSSVETRTVPAPKRTWK